MKLKITRDQADKKGMFGGHKGVNFSIFAKADVTPEEKQLIDHYKMGSLVIGKWEPDNEKDVYDGRLSVEGLLNGRSIYSESLGKLQALEDEIVNSCKRLKNYLAVARSFGDEIVIDIE